MHMKYLTLSAAMLALALFRFGLSADAGHKSHGSYGSAGSTGSSGGSYASNGGSYGSSGGSSGGISRREARLIERAERHDASHGSSGSLGSTGSSGGSYGSHGSSGGSSGSYESTGHRHHSLLRGLFHGSSGSHGSASSGGASSGVSSGSYGSASSGGHLQSAYATPGTQYHAALRSPGYAVRPNAVPAAEFAYVVVQLPEDATLILGGNRTSVSGNIRKFKIPLSDTQQGYPYTVRAELTRGGQLFVAQSTETLVAGQTINVKVNDVAAPPTVDVATR
jgi:uncharacterized protein (TIGR03000 family)